MSDDLNLLISFYSTSGELVKCAVKIPHGMNDPEWYEWQYFRERGIEELILNAMHPHVASFCERILAVEEIFDIKEY